MMGFLASIPDPVWFAALGALAIQLLGLMELSKIPRSQRPDFRDVFYWIPYFIHPALGGLLAFAYVASSTDLAPMLAINVGVTAPLILRSAANAVDKPIEVPEDA